MRQRLRKKLHRQYLVTICGFVVTFDDQLRKRLLASEPGTLFRIDGNCRPWVERLLRKHRLRFCVTLARKLGPACAVVVYWAEEFPVVRDEAALFSIKD